MSRKIRCMICNDWIPSRGFGLHGYWAHGMRSVSPGPADFTWDEFQGVSTDDLVRLQGRIKYELGLRAMESALQCGPVSVSVRLT
jgi:hypothetical protein